MRRSLRATMAAAVGFAFLTGCSQAISGEGEAEKPLTFPSDIQSLGALLSRGNLSIKTAHLSLTESTPGQTVKATGAEILSAGKVRSMDLSETVNTIALRFIIIGSQVYAKLPSSVFQATKPWVQLTSTTSQPVLQQLYKSFQSSLQTGTGTSVNTLVSAGKDLSFKGTEQLNGVTVGHYLVDVDVNRLPTSFPNRESLVQLGVAKLPVELYLDQDGRPRKVTESLTVAGQHVTVLITLGNFDAPTKIAPPPADQVEKP